MIPDTNTYFTSFKDSIDHIDLPEKFTFPFHYEPHPIALLAVKELQQYISSATWVHDFGLEQSNNELASGKMFGVLVVKNSEGNIGYLSGFSGQLSDKNDLSRFVPPICDILTETGHFAVESKKLTTINKEIERLVSDESFLRGEEKLNIQAEQINGLIAAQLVKLKKEKKKRKTVRKEQEKKLSTEDFLALQTLHKQESINDTFLYNEYAEYLHGKLEKEKQTVTSHKQKISSLKEERKAFSARLQNWLFEQYDFLNIKGTTKNVLDIFKGRVPEVPPAGTGDCAAPKLLQYAFSHQLTPIALAEFWWGKEPQSKIRRHGYFYPACRGKCEPVLGHMLSGIELDPNPLLVNHSVGKQLETIYEDENLLVINKPADFLSVPGKDVTDSVQERMQLKYPKCSGPFIVHRLDMSTSGLLIITKTKEVNQFIQEQFKTRKVKKRYVALLDGEIKEEEGFIDLPLRVDLENRPFQLVCHEKGKSARTKWKVIERKNGQTKIHFHPITGRTHQLRVHAAHKSGLNAPIVGDDLYGKKGTKLHLHAESIEFTHPITKKVVSFSIPAEF
ncbi:MAG: RluA family pseudouridine synthase [Cyclobacteriaceae bacterium]